MREIIVAGAGHGGISCAGTLAMNGYKVTVYEKRQREKLGHDWHDVCDKPAFRFAGIPLPDDKDYYPGYDMAYYNPKHTVKVVRPYSDPDGNTMMIDRKILLKHLIGWAESCGVEFRFGCPVTGVLTEENRVTGIKVIADDEEKEICADLVIDAAGVDSPVRQSLPEEFGIRNNIDFCDAFHIYRAYFNNTTGQTTEPEYNVHLYCCGVPGISWAITEPDFVDILIGKFGELSKDEADMCLKHMKETYTFMGDEILRGGYLAKIPLLKTLSKIICNGYALVGDSAGMTVPMNGCGISLSLKAGKILANTILSIKDGEYSTEALWRYQYNYYKLCGESLTIIAKAKEYFSQINDETVDFCLESGLLSEKEMEMAGGDFSAINLQYILDKVKAVAPKIHKLPSVLAKFRTVPSFNSVFDDMPFEYDEKKFLEWQKKYNRL